MAKKHKVFIVDDHPILVDGLTKMINHEKDMEFCGSASSCREALEEIASAKPDIAIIDINLKDSSGLDLITSLSIPVLVLSMHDENVYAERALLAGARGYIMKEEKAEKMVHAIRHILSGQIYLSPNITTKILDRRIGKSISDSPLETLSNREIAVFQMVGEGFTRREIAQKLFLSPKTIDSYYSHIKEKLNLKNNQELIRKATLHVHSPGIK
ncbi:response regulator [Candidatus Uabimicrobium sp. HlEnr_7]|uniref:response regulator n=1 Tax=Candidatus Uabimicrobium helgolandensis TaxID=3095367 RepID=UPI003558DC7F